MSPEHIVVDLAAPSSVRINKKDTETEITFDWFNANHWSSAANSIVFLLFIFIIPWLSPNTQNASRTVLMAVWILFACLLAYHALAGILNQTTAKVSKQSLTLAYGPLPWPRRDHAHQFATIDAIFVKQDRTAAIWRHNYPRIFYAVYVISNGKTIPIFRYIGSELTAAYLCIEIQSALGKSVKPYWYSLLEQLNDNRTDSPLFGAEKPLLYHAEQIADAVQTMFQYQYRGHLAMVINERRTQFDALHFDHGEGKLYYLTRIYINPIPSATNVVVHQKTVPHLGAKWGHQRTINRFLCEIEAHLERDQ